MPWINELMNLTLYGLHDQVLQLLQSGHSPDGPGDLYLTPLHVAILNNDIRMTRILLNHNADIELRNHEENTPIYSCLKNNVSIELLGLMLSSNAKLDVTNMLDRTPLHVAAQFSKSPEKIKRIITRIQSDTINRIDYFGNTAFHYLMRNKKLTEDKMFDLVTLFTHSDANMAIPDGDGQTPLHLALKHSFCSSLLVLPSLLLPWSVKWKYGQNILHFMFYKSKDAGQIFLLLTERADTYSEIKEMLNEKDDTGFSAFSVYLRRWDCDQVIVNKMVRMGADISTVANDLCATLDLLKLVNSKSDYRDSISAKKTEATKIYLDKKNVENDKECKNVKLFPSFSIEMDYLTLSVQNTISKLMEKLANRISQLDTRFEVKVKQLNKISENNDERSTFEFAFCLKKFADICEVYHCDTATYLLSLRSKDFPPPQEYEYFFDANRNLQPSLLKDTFSDLFRLALSDEKIWSFPRISVIRQPVNTYEQDDQSFKIAWTISNDICLLFKVIVCPVIEDDRILPWTLYTNSVPMQNREFIINNGVMFRVPKFGQRYFSTLYSKYDLFDEEILK